GGDPFDGGAAGAIGTEGLPEEGPEGQPGGEDDRFPGGAFLVEDLSDGGLREDVVEAELGLGSSRLQEAVELGAEPGCGSMSHARPPCGWWGPEHPHHPASEVSFHSPGGAGRDEDGLAVLSESRPQSIRFST